jgi:hypothetical protein
MHNRPIIQLIQEPRLELRPLMTPCLRRAREQRPDGGRDAAPDAAAGEPPWRERRGRATAAAPRRSAR